MSMLEKSAAGIRYGEDNDESRNKTWQLHLIGVSREGKRFSVDFKP